MPPAQKPSRATSPEPTEPSPVDVAAGNDPVHDASAEPLPSTVESDDAPKTTDGVHLVLSPDQKLDAVDLSGHVDGDLTIYRGQTAKVTAAEAKTLLALRDSWGLAFVAKA